jgi:hypothetical protein
MPGHSNSDVPNPPSPAKNRCMLQLRGLGQPDPSLPLSVYFSLYMTVDDVNYFPMSYIYQCGLTNFLFLF